MDKNHVKINESHVKKKNKKTYENKWIIWKINDLSFTCTCEKKMNHMNINEPCEEILKSKINVACGKLIIWKEIYYEGEIINKLSELCKFTY